MPELPEVETVRRGLEPLLRGGVLTHVDVLDPRLVQPATITDIESVLTGRQVTAVERRGKYLRLRLDGGISALHHLRMTGSFAAPGAPVPSHVRLRYFVDAAAEPIVYNDPRRFGTLHVDLDEAIDAYLDARLGPEPLSDGWTAGVLRRAIGSRSAPIKAVLLDQRVVAGLGNIYVDEACFLAGVRPEVAANSIGMARLERLVTAVRSRLREAIDVGGSTLRDYRGVEGTAGGMQERFLAYGRADKPCLTCGATMRGLRIAGRSTSYCPRCQR